MIDTALVCCLTTFELSSSFYRMAFCKNGWNFYCYLSGIYMDFFIFSTYLPWESHASSEKYNLAHK